tara:strand:+ start:741 stop:920 length:180 start_codon:yes stop_codon:yes gene_type:complete
MKNNDDNKERNKLIKEYIDQLSNDEKIILKIAEKQLKSSFSIEKSIGFLSWIKNKDLEK